MEQKVFKKVLEKNKIKRPVFINCIKAFIVGGFICLIGEIFLNIYSKILNFIHKQNKINK